MSNKLKELFHMIEERNEILNKINSSANLSKIFGSWKTVQQEEFLNFCSGEKGVKILYDSFFKEIFNPEYSPERLSTLLSLLIGEKVTIIEVLPNDSTRIGMESSLLITDITVKLANRELANIEIQKIGYMFPGERAACYSADLLLRQYKQARNEHTEHFSYKSIKNVYTIVIFEKSPTEFHSMPDKYIHKFRQSSDTGLEMELLQKYIFVSIDNFKNIHKNKDIDIETELDAWLAFLSFDEPEMIAKLIKFYPEFTSMYKDIYNLCKNTERVIGMFSEELKILDKNTVQYMIDYMQDEINAKNKKLEELTNSMAIKDLQFADTLAEKESQFADTLAKKESQFADTLAKKESQFADTLAKQQAEIEQLKAQLAKNTP